MSEVVSSDDGQVRILPAGGSEHVAELAAVLNEALAIYAERQKSYGQQWRKYGVKGALYSARRKIERAWAQLWDGPAESHPLAGVSGVDDLLDTINYAAMAILCVRSGNRDGEGAWW